MERFSYVCPVKTYFGKGIMGEALESEMRYTGKNVLLAYGCGSVKKTGVHAQIRAILDAAGKKVVEFAGITADPAYEKVCEGAQICREEKIDFILAVGGGSVADCCKVIAAAAKLDGDIWEYECVKRQQPTASIPVGVVLTAFGTGSEQNDSGVITNRRMGEKRSLKGAYPRFAVLDTDCARSLPADLLMAGAFDTLSHCMEIYFSLPDEAVVSDEMNEAVMRNVIRNMRALKEDFGNEAARSELAWDSALAMNGVLKAGKRPAFQAHQIAHQLGAYTGCTHGKALAVIQPSYYKHTYRRAAEKFARFAQNVWGIEAQGLDDGEMAVKGIEELEKFIKQMGLPASLHELGEVSENLLGKVAETTYIMDTSCERLTEGMVMEILKDCL